MYSIIVIGVPFLGKSLTYYFMEKLKEKFREKLCDNNIITIR